MSKKQGTKKAGKVIAYVAILLLLVSLCGFLAYFTNGFTSDFKTFYVEVNGEQILSNKSGYEMSKDNPLTFDVKYTFDKVSEEVSGYTVKVIPNSIEGKDFEFTVDGESIAYSQVTDLTAGFDIELEENSFTISPKGGITAILQSVYEGKEVLDCTGSSYKDMYKLVITSYNGESSIEIDFSIKETLTGVTLDKEVLYF